MSLYLLGFTAVLAMVYLIYMRHQAALRQQDEELLVDVEARPATFLTRHQWVANRLTFLHFGFVFALGFVSLAFEYTSSTSPLSAQNSIEVPPIIEIEVVRTPAERPPEIPDLPYPPQRQELTTLLELVPDEAPLPDLITESPEPVVPVDAKVKLVLPPPPPPAPKPEPPAERISDIPFVVVEQMPRFIGCEDEDRELRDACAEKKMLEYIYSNYRVPKLAKENGIQGITVVNFVIERDGSITGTNIVRDPGAGIGREAMRVVESMPAWTPGRQRGEAVRVEFNLPIRVRLD